MYVYVYTYIFDVIVFMWGIQMSGDFCYMYIFPQGQINISIYIGCFMYNVTTVFAVGCAFDIISGQNNLRGSHSKCRKSTGQYIELSRVTVSGKNLFPSPLVLGGSCRAHQMEDN